MLRRKLSLLLLWGLVIQEALCGELKTIAQQPTNVLSDFYAYRHISIIHFDVPECTVSARFKFTMKEEKTGGIGRCSPRNVSLHLKSGSIPLVQPDGSKIAATLIKGRRKYYSATMESDNQEYNLRIDGPPPGDWYAIAFRSWTDPEDGKITQQGLGVSCDTIVDATLSVETASADILLDANGKSEIHLDREKNSSVVRMIVPHHFGESQLSVKSTCGKDCRVNVHVTAEDVLAGAIVNSTEVTVPFKPYTSTFHYLTLQLLSGEASNLSVQLYDIVPVNRSQLNLIDTRRKSLPEFFLFDYEYVCENATKSSPVNLTADLMTVLNFEIGRIYDVGGTLTIGLKLPDDVERDKETSLVVVGCLSLGYYANISADAGCDREKSTTAGDIYANGTSPNYIHIPYPEPGPWHLSLRAFCFNDNCSCAESCLNGTLCEGCDCVRWCSARVESMISSSPCIEGRCNSRGKCMHYMSGGFVFAACHCVNGYRGFDCADDAYVLGKSDVIVRVLLLTLSNLAFVGSVYAAIRREYFTEAIVYAAVMFFSTFYHACEAAEDVYSFCIARLSVLQFCDFFNALLSIWVTLVAMAAFGPRLTAFCQIAGAVILAMAAEMDRTALWVFLLPAVTGSAAIGLSWGSRCRTKRTVFYPSRPYRLLYFPAGLLLVSSGLICYAFFQTRRNYYILHSFWHICVALGVVLLLPKRKYMT